MLEASLERSLSGTKDDKLSMRLNIEGSLERPDSGSQVSSDGALAPYRRAPNNSSELGVHASETGVGSVDVLLGDNVEANRIRVNRAIAFLLRASNILSRSLDVGTNLKDLKRLIVPSIADNFTVHLLPSDPAIWQGQSEFSSSGIGQRLIQEVGVTAQPIVFSRNGVIAANRNNTVLFDGVASQSHSVIDFFSRSNLQAVAIIPIVSRGTPIGIMLLETNVGRRGFDHRDVAMLNELARRIASALENARLLRDAQQAREEFRIANKVKGDFLAAMSHELRTPLNAIAGYCQLMMLGLRGTVTDEQKEDLAKIIQNQNHLLVLINSILNYSKIEGGEINYEMSKISIVEILDEMSDTIRKRLSDGNLSIVCESPEIRHGGDVSVVADKEKVKQILMNLLTNAVKFSPEGGVIAAGYKVRAKHVHLYVRDNGPGISVDKIKNIFEPFVQIDRSLNTVHEGVGLGLSISRDLARAMGGDIMVQSEEGKGATFTVTFPLAAV